MTKTLHKKFLCFMEIDSSLDDLDSTDLKLTYETDASIADLDDEMKHF